MAAILVAMVGCNKEAKVENGGISSDDKVYMSFSVQTLTTRSATENDGSSNAEPDTEVGDINENYISSVDIVLRNEDTYVCASVTSPSLSQSDKWVATFKSSLLSTGTEYEVYVYANCSAKQNIDAVSEASIADMTEEKKFWMTNAEEPIKKTFTKFSTDPTKPEDIGTVKVERSMARFDYKPKGSYSVGDVTVTLKEAALINQSKAFYLLRRVSANGTDTDWTVGGGETETNFVVDTDFEIKKRGLTAATYLRFDQHLHSPEDWTWKTLEGLAKEDNWDGDTGYYVWQYCKENTIPGAELQVKGISTGIVFKGELTGGKVPANGTDPIYVFDNVLYGTWEQVVAAAETNETLKFYTDKFGDEITASEATYAELGKAGFTAYKPEGGKYYAYYYYWNRHNDNGNNTDMGPMEFAVVRNNVYKISVEKISKFGHPNPDDESPVDPDPIDPNDPDESGEYYFTVSAEVLPWVVRINNIEF